MCPRILQWTWDRRDVLDERETVETLWTRKLSAWPSVRWYWKESFCIHILLCRRTNWNGQEQSGLPETSFDENIPLVGGFAYDEDKPVILDRAREIITRSPKVNFAKLGPIRFMKKGDEAKIVSCGPKGGESDILKKDDSGERLVTPRQTNHKKKPISWQEALHPRKRKDRTKRTTQQHETTRRP